MSEILTTGQMIDNLKVGEKAEMVYNPLPQVSNDHIVRESTYLKWENGERFQLNNYTLEVTWRILPNYVSFEEAMKALKEGKGVTLHDEDGGYTTFCEADQVRFLSDEIPNITFSELCSGKWTIEE